MGGCNKSKILNFFYTYNISIRCKYKNLTELKRKKKNKNSTDNFEGLGNESLGFEKDFNLANHLLTNFCCQFYTVFFLFFHRPLTYLTLNYNKSKKETSKKTCSFLQLALLITSKLPIFKTTYLSTFKTVNKAIVIPKYKQ